MTPFEAGSVVPQDSLPESKTSQKVTLLFSSEASFSDISVTCIKENLIYDKGLLCARLFAFRTF